MSAPFGPFGVVAEQIVRLQYSFTPFVNRLLDVERAAAGQVGTSLQTSSWENVADGGVDASMSSSVATDWIPKGDSVWQFKRGDLPPAKARAELRGATLVKELLAGGAVYRLVLGAHLTPSKIKSRKAALVAEAKDLGLPADPSLFEVLDADALARWASTHRSLAVSKLLGGPGNVATDFTAWSTSIRHQSTWVTTPARDAILAEIRNSLGDQGITDLRVEGVSGLGKTRVVMEACRGQDFESLVTYVPDGADLAGEYLQDLLGRDGPTVVIVDECSGKQHEKFAQRIPTGSPLKLITIGEPDSYAIRAPVKQLSPLDDAAVEAVLAENMSGLSPEVRRVVAVKAGGNVRFAMWLGERIARDPKLSATSLITVENINQFITGALPDGPHFLASGVLALFSRVGWDGEVRGELDLIAGALGLDVSDLRRAGRQLEAQGLFVKQGRYRSVAPHPVAVLLAAEAWRELEEEIVQDLVPQLSEELALGLFTRAADIGDFEPTRSASTQLLRPDGPFGTLASIASGNNGRLLTQIAIVAPDATSRRLAEIISATPDDELLNLKSTRRDLVWTLGKLAWHSRTFEEAADGLLRLALAENETWSNNATGTWIELFGTMLPGTSARPAVRAGYLGRTAEDGDPRVRALSVKGASHALRPHEFIMVSNELQGGVLVEPRGRPATYGEAFEYQRQMIHVLRDRLHDSDGDISNAAVDAVIAAIHPLLEAQPLRDDLVAAILAMDESGLRRVRTELAHLGSLFDRVSRPDQPSTTNEAPNDVAGRVAALRDLEERLPPISVAEELHVLARSNRWEFEDGVLLSRIVSLVQAGGLSSGDVLNMLTIEVPAAFELGSALAIANGHDDEIVGRLVELLDVNFAALAGYLWALHDSGDESAFDDFLRTPLASSLSPHVRASIAVRGPVSEIGLDAVTALVREMSPRDGARALLGWQRNLSVERAQAMISDWLGRMSSQEDYNAVVDFTLMVIHGRDEVARELLLSISALVERRVEFPDIGQESWDWAQLAEVVLADAPERVAEVLLGLMNDDAVFVHESSEDAALLRRCAEIAPDQVWQGLAALLEGGSWRVQMSVRGWLVGVIPLEIIDAWIGQDLARGQLVASIAPAGGNEPTPVARLLLQRFGGDDSVASSLTADVFSGSWMGNYSDRLAGQINQFENWVNSESEGPEVKRWARRLIGSLQNQRAQALEREAEGDF